MMEHTWHVRLEALQDQLGSGALPFVTALAHGTMSVELFAPRGPDTQQPHAQDELYIIRQGSGWFLNEGEQVAVKAGDVLFVRAGVEHRFYDFSPDFETWVVFWGPQGGEG